MITVQQMEKPDKITVYDILPGFDSFVSDMETNLKMDRETWAQYRENPVPFVVDLLSDFGEFRPDIECGFVHNVIVSVVDKWAGPLGFSDPAFIETLAGRVWE